MSAAQALIASGRRVVADIDLEKFFDRVNHDILMGLVAKRVADPRILKLIRGFLTAACWQDGLVGPTDEGTPQGGPLSPLLSNLMLDVLDKELERRGHRFVRYADDCNIYVCSQRAGERVMAGVERFLERRLKLKVNRARARSRRRRGASSSGSASRAGRRRNAASLRRRWPASRNGCARRRSGRREQVSKRSSKSLSRYLIGWRGYFGFCETPSALRVLDRWVRRRLRSIVWKQWKRGTTRFAELRRRGVGHDLAAQTAGSAHGPWRISNSPALAIALPNDLFRKSLRLASLSAGESRIINRTAVYGPVRTVVWEGRSRKAPPYPDCVAFINNSVPVHERSRRLDRPGKGVKRRRMPHGRFKGSRASGRRNRKLLGPDRGKFFAPRKDPIAV